MRKFSVIIPVYNRPNELDELLETLVLQTLNTFEVIVVDDGSTTTSESIVEKYKAKLDIKYFFKENSGQGFTRNFGFKHATGDFFVIFDSDILVPKDYFAIVNEALNREELDAYGGPDEEHPSFTPVQKAISYSMTSIFTTGGIRGGKKRLAPYHPRSFNMGFSRDVYDRCFGFIITRMAEDLELSIRIIQSGFRVGLIQDAFVYHKRRTSFKQFFKQLFFFGQGRINILRYYPRQLKPLHTLPALFVLAIISLIISIFIQPVFSLLISSVLLIYFVILFIDSYKKLKGFKLAVLSVLASFIQLSAYGLGFLYELFVYVVKRR